MITKPFAPDLGVQNEHTLISDGSNFDTWNDAFHKFFIEEKFANSLSLFWTGQMRVDLQSQAQNTNQSQPNTTNLRYSMRRITTPGPTRLQLHQSLVSINLHPMMMWVMIPAKELVSKFKIVEFVQFLNLRASNLLEICFLYGETHVAEIGYAIHSVFIH